MTAAAPAPSRLRLVEWKPYSRNTLCGFATVELPLGLTIADIAVHQKGARRWASLPAKPLLNNENCHAVDENGKKKYVAILSWRDRVLADEFSRRVVGLVAAEYPEAFESETP
jgi:hypothetical protein